VNRTSGQPVMSPAAAACSSLWIFAAAGRQHVDDLGHAEHRGVLQRGFPLRTPPDSDTHTEGPALPYLAVACLA
jgi:hypothetical protein